MRAFAIIIGAVATITIAAASFSAFAQSPSAVHGAKKRHPPMLRTATGRVVEPTRTIIHNPDGSTTVIVVPRRSYLNPGTDVPLGYGKRLDYAFPVGGDPGRPYWYFGPSNIGAVGGLPLAQPFLLPGFNTNYPLPY
jgi:hypothetical protein